MLLVTTTLLLAVGFATWILGEIFSYRGIGTIGASIVLIVGGAIVLTGLEVKTGSVKTVDYTTVNNSTVANQTTIHTQYTPTAVGEIFGVGILGSLGIGGLLMLLGATLLSQTLTEDMN